MRAAAAGSRLRRPCNGIDVTVHLTLLGTRRMVVRLSPVTFVFCAKARPSRARPRIYRFPSKNRPWKSNSYVVERSFSSAAPLAFAQFRFFEAVLEQIALDSLKEFISSPALAPGLLS